MTEEVCCLFLGSAAVLWKEKSRGLAWSLVLKFWRQEHKWLLWTWPWGGRKKETAAEFPILLSLPRYSGKEGRQGGGSWNLHFSPHRMPFCCFQLAPRRWRDQYRYFPGKGIRQEHVPWWSCLEYRVVFDIAWCRGKVKILQGENCCCRLLLQGKKEVNESGEEKELSLSLLPPPKLTNRMANGACRSSGKHSAMMKTISYPIITTAAEGSENASASIRNQNSFFGAALALFRVSFGGCTADTDSRPLLKYSLQRAGVKQLHTPTPLTHLD